MADPSPGGSSSASNPNPIAPAPFEAPVVEGLRRRRQVASSETDPEEEEEEVERHLTGAWWKEAVRAEEERERAEARAREAQQQQEEAPPAGHQPGGEPAAEEQDERVCRICFGGVADEAESGKLISPCVCRGTSRWVHVACLNTWRLQSAGQTSYFQCDQCNFKYRLARSRLAGLAENPIALTVLASLILSFLIFLAGFAATFLIEFIEERQLYLAEAGGVGAWYEEMFVSDHVLIGEAVKEASGFLGDRMVGLPALQMEDYARPPNWAWRAVAHSIKGISLIGILSFSQLMLAASFFSPFGFRSPLLRMFRPRTGGGNRRNDRGGASINTLVIAAFLAVGLARASLQVYRLTKWLAKQGLRRVEDIILEV